ncbi:MAG: DUF4907 domain-containing protein [Burkholderiales bacterium]|nr:DUF4907 domain-containing protein [Bacteroidia bacterium]
MIKTLLNFIFTALMICSCSPEQKTDVAGNVVPKPMPGNEFATTYSSTIFLCDSTNSDFGFGYNIITNDHIFIHQPTVPSIPGNKGFSTRAGAERTAEFIIFKLTHNMMPPSVTPRELDSLGVFIK